MDKRLLCILKVLKVGSILVFELHSATGSWNSQQTFSLWEAEERTLDNNLLHKEISTTVFDREKYTMWIFVTCISPRCYWSVFHLFWLKTNYTWEGSDPHTYTLVADTFSIMFHNVFARLLSQCGFCRHEASLFFIARYIAQHLVIPRCYVR